MIKNIAPPKAPNFILWGLLAVYLLLAITTAATRQPYPDEAEMNCPAYMLIHRGYLGVNLWDQFRDSHKAYFQPPMFFLSQALLQVVIGSDVIAMRMGPVLWGLLVLILIYQILRRLPLPGVPDRLSQGMALFAVGTLALDYTYNMHAGIGRSELMSLGMAICAFWVYLIFRETSLAKAVMLSHACMAIAALTHPVGMIAWGPVLVGFQIWQDRKVLQWRSLVWMGVPYLAGLTAWGLYILQDPESFRAQFMDFALFGGRLSGFSSPLSGFVREITVRLLGYYGVRTDASASALVLVKLILPIGYLMAIAASLLYRDLRRDPILRMSLIGLFLQYFFLSLVEGSKQYHYTVYYIPLVTLIEARVLYLWRPKMSQLVFAGLVASLAIVQVGPIMFRAREDRYHKHYQPVAEFVRPYVEAQSLIVTEAEFGITFGYPDNVITDYAYGYKRAKRPRIVIAEDIIFANSKELYRKIKPDQYRYLVEEFPAEYEIVFKKGNYKVYRRRAEP